MNSKNEVDSIDFGQTNLLKYVYMKYPNKTAAILLIASSILLSSCSSMKASPAETTPFLTHGTDLQPNARMPFDAVWSSNPGHIVVKSTAQRKFYVDAISTQYLNQKKNEKGVWTGDAGVSPEDVKVISDQLRQNIIDEFKNKREANVLVVDKSGPDAQTLSIALTELVPTKVAVNVVADVGGVLVPGTKAIEEAGVVGAQAASGSFSAGSIAIEIKLIDGTTGASLAEGKDRESDPASILPNYRDFEKFGWSRATCKQWAREIVEAFSKDFDTKIKGESHFSILPW